jgi:sulfite exporter TauE/SafE
VIDHAMHHMAAAGNISLAAAFIGGFAGSVHCLAMCGGISGALALHSRRVGSAARRAVLHGACHQAGRLTSYTVAGMLCGGFGSALMALMDLSRVALAVRVAAGLLLIAMSLRVLLGWRLLGVIERWGARFWSRLAPLARAVGPGAVGSRGLGSALLLGMIWGWLPCGLVYSMLMFAAMSGGPVAGGAIMLLFGLGTLPAMFGGGWAGGHAWRLSTARGLHTAAGALLFVFGLITVLGPLGHLHH